MKKQIYKLCFVVFFTLFAGFASADAISSLPEFTNNDRVLVLAPHPDDEAIGAGGAIQRALKAGAKVKTVLMTYGDNNELSFIIYKKRLLFGHQEYLKMGELRRSESIKAMTSLGLKESDVISLGYPDFGIMDIMTQYWGETLAFRSMLTHRRQVPYSDAMSFGLPYVGESVLKDLEKILLDYKPTKIFVSHPAEANRDHRALYLFLRVALWDIDGKIESPQVFPYIIHVVGWPKPRGYHPELRMTIPTPLKNSDILWRNLELTPDERMKKYNAINCYTSQVKCAPTYLVSFARQNELFGDYPEIKIIHQIGPNVVWQYLGEGDDLMSLANANISSLSYARVGDSLLVRVALKAVLDKEFGVSVYLLGYKRGISFSAMPKIHLIAGIDGFTVKDKRKRLAAKEVQYTSKEKELIFSVPLSLLGNPDYILSSAHTSLFNMTEDETAWRVLSLN